MMRRGSKRWHRARRHARRALVRLFRGTAYRGCDGAVTCVLCHCEMDGDLCDSCCGDGFYDGYDDDPLWYDQGELVTCENCGGRGMLWFCCHQQCPTGLAYRIFTVLPLRKCSR